MKYLKAAIPKASAGHLLIFGSYFFEFWHRACRYLHIEGPNSTGCSHRLLPEGQNIFDFRLCKCGNVFATSPAIEIFRHISSIVSSAATRARLLPVAASTLPTLRSSPRSGQLRLWVVRLLTAAGSQEQSLQYRFGFCRFSRITPINRDSRDQSIRNGSMYLGLRVASSSRVNSETTSPSSSPVKP